MKKIFLLLSLLFLTSCFKNPNETDICKHEYKKHVILEATCQTEGIAKYTCINCLDYYEEEIKIKEHDYAENVLIEVTCTSNGLKEYTCYNCLHSYEEVVDMLGHKYIEGKCDNCGGKEPTNDDNYLYELFGDDIEIYTNKDRNPYGINLDTYGDNVQAYIYEPNLSIIADPYTNVNKTEFYNDYEPSTSYEDSYYRSKHYLMSGDISDQKHLPGTKAKMLDDKAVRLTDATYVLDPDGNYLAYVINSFDDNDSIIFYGGGYTSLNEVAAYLLAFGEVPANQHTKKTSSAQREIISQWGKYGRVNDGRFSGDTSSHPYEPELPTIKTVRFNEIDFGTIGGYTTSNSNGYNRTQTIYNNGSSITRGAARIVYTADTSIKNINQRYVFYTYTHYNDFQEYLNYYDGWGVRFGNESAGNEYCSGSGDYYDLKCVPPTKYPQTLLKKYIELI